MNQKELVQLANLLAQFHNTDFGHNGSIYGRAVDKALASDLRASLFAYGIDSYVRDDHGDLVLDEHDDPIKPTLTRIIRG